MIAYMRNTKNTKNNMNIIFSLGIFFETRYEVKKHGVGLNPA